MAQAHAPRALTHAVTSGPHMARHRPPWLHPLGWLLLAAVTLAHVLASNELMADRFGWGSGSKSISRIEVAFVRELVQVAPPELAPQPAANTRAASLPAVARAASAAKAESGPAVPAVPEPQLDVKVAAAEPPDAQPKVPSHTAPQPPALEPAPPPTSVPEIAAAADAQASAAAASSAVLAPRSMAGDASKAALPHAQAFEWPPSTRLVYQMTGNFRGPIQGRAQVDWLRSGTRYQVHLETSVAPLLSRRITSEGELTERGLAPRRFEGEQKVILRAPRRWSQQFGAERIVLGDGREVDTLPGAQDEASQFVQLTWLFTTQPQLLRVGNSIDIPLAINRRFDRWTYDVKEVQQLHLPFGQVETYYVKPRREAKGGEMTAEIWFAPSLQYLPVRILIRQDETTYVDLMLDKPPLQANR